MSQVYTIELVTEDYTKEYLLLEAHSNFRTFSKRVLVSLDLELDHCSTEAILLTTWRNGKIVYKAEYTKIEIVTRTPSDISHSCGYTVSRHNEWKLGVLDI